MSNTKEFNTDLPSMHHGRYGCAAAALRDKYLFALGGRKEKSGEMYDVATKQWIALNKPMSTVRYGAAAVALGDDIIVMGGDDGKGNFLSSVEKYNTITRKWSPFPSMNSPRIGCAAAVVNGRIIVVGGFNGIGYRDGNKYLASVEEYDPATQKWVTITPMHIRRINCAATVLGGQLYVLGGRNYDGGNKLNYLSSAEVYNPTTKRWTLIADMINARSGCAAASFGEEMIVVGGYDGIGYLASCEAYDTATQQWSSMVSMSTERSYCAAVEVKGSLYVMGGKDDKSNYLSSMESLLIQPNPQTQTRTSPPALTASLADQAPSSQLPHTMQLLQEKIPTADFTPVVAAEVIQVEESCISESMDSMSLNQNLLNVSIEEICQWLSRNGISTASLDIIRREEIDGAFLFTESFDEIKMVLKGEGMKIGQVSRIRLAIEKAKREGSLS